MIALTIITIVGFAVIVVAGARLGAGSVDSIAEIWVSPTPLDRPRGVQEEDLPRFVFRDSAPSGSAAA